MKGNYGKELTLSILDNRNLEIIFELMETNDDEVLKNISYLLHEILSFKLNDMNTINISNENENNSNNYLVVLLEKKLSTIIEKIFDEEYFKNSTKTTFGRSVKIFGLGRMKLLECFLLFLKLQNEESINDFEFYKFFDKILVRFI